MSELLSSAQTSISGLPRVPALSLLSRAAAHHGTPSPVFTAGSLLFELRPVHHLNCSAAPSLSRHRCRNPKLAALSNSSI
ncbi:hypothetical protein M0R45_019917 [Rubus argutus]|uniref:Uncharacterized protein n=1 Tax=Rubus argutus TaxID=59490 RepID=A0AAW1X7R2_RUBAR